VIGTIMFLTLYGWSGPSVERATLPPPRKILPGGLLATHDLGEVVDREVLAVH
jgi:hypothetical protein